MGQTDEAGARTMSEESDWITEVWGPGWFFRYDTTHAPEYVLLTMRGQPTIERTERVIHLLHHYRARTMLPSGEVCPLITDLSQDGLPSATVLEGIYRRMLPINPQLSYHVCVLDPYRPDAERLHLALEGLGLGLSPKVTAAASLSEALAKVREFHHWRATR
jgi:hypothetical protein